MDPRWWRLPTTSTLSSALRWRSAMREALLLLAVMAATATPLPALARIQPDIVCLDTDMEFPVACDEDAREHVVSRRLLRL